MAKALRLGGSGSAQFDDEGASDACRHCCYQPFLAPTREHRLFIVHLENARQPSSAAFNGGYGSAIKISS